MERSVPITTQIKRFIDTSKELSLAASAFWIFFFGMIYISTNNILLFHTGTEFFSSIMGFSIFTMCVNSFPISKNKFTMVLGIGYAFVALTDIFHTITYPGIDMIGQGSLGVSSEFWIAARFIEAAALLVSSLYAFDKIKKLNINLIFMLFFSAFGLCAMSILAFSIFPACYTPEVGITGFNVACEYLVAAILASIGIAYYIRRDRIDKGLFIYMELNIILTIFIEIIFTRHILPNDYSIVVAHMLKVLSFYCIYKSIIEQGLNNPYTLLFSNLAKAKKTIEIKTSEIEDINHKLQAVKAYSDEIGAFLQKNEICFELLIHKSPLVIYAHSGGKFIFANSKSAEFFGLERSEELIGEQVLDFFPEERVDSDKNVKEVYRKITGTDSMETTVLTAKGKLKDVSLVRTIFKYRGKPACLSILWDITTVKQVKVLEKDARESKRRLDESLEFNKLIKEFFANLSHELRTPLNVILGALQVAELNRPLDTAESRLERYDKYGKILKQNCYRLLRLINNLIDMSRMDAGFFHLNLKNQNIVSLVEDITLSVAEYIEGKGVNLIFDTDVEEKIMACDPDKIERVMLNLLSNAVKFTSAGDDILVTIVDEGQNIAISVKDTGVGIPKEKLEMIFERFRQVDSSLSRNKEGSGIGLSLVKSFIEMHGGTITVISEENVSTEFTVRIPVKLLGDEAKVQGDMMCSSNVERISIEFSDIYS